jgi:SAM-dependent methyltransferase
MKLNLCCGANIFPGWHNVDRVDMEQAYLRHLREAPDGFVWPEPQRKLAEWVKAGKPLHFEQYDVRRGLLPWADNSVEAIYIGQAIEHFNRRTEAPALLRECARVLRQYGVIRLTTPDLKLLVQTYAIESADGDWGFQDQGMEQWQKEQPAFYADALPEDKLSYLLFGASGDGSTNESYEGHHHCYTPRSLGQLLNECGLDTRVSNSPEFSDCVDMGLSHSFAVEAVKP